MAEEHEVVEKSILTFSFTDFFFSLFHCKSNLYLCNEVNEILSNNIKCKGEV